MRRGHDLVGSEEDVLFRGLRFEDVERCAGDVTARNGVLECCLVDETAAGAVDDAHALLCLRERLRVEDVAGLVGERRVQGDEVGAHQEFLELNLVDAHGFGAFGAEVRVEGGDLHAQALGAVGDDRADVAAADDAERLACEFDAHEAVLFPFAGVRRGVGGGDLAGEGEHQRDGVLGRRDRVAVRRVHDDDAAAGGGWDVDVVDADTGAADDLEVRGGGEDVGGDLRRGADREAVVVGDDGFQFVLREADLHVDVDAAILEDLHGSRGQLIRDQDFGHGWCSGNAGRAM